MEAFVKIKLYRICLVRRRSRGKAVTKTIRVRRLLHPLARLDNNVCCHK